MHKRSRLKLKTSARRTDKPPEKRAPLKPGSATPRHAPKPSWAAICDAYLAGIAAGETTSALLESHPEWGIDHASAMHLRIVDDEELFARYMRARRAAVIGVAESILEIVDNSTNDWMEKESGKGNVYIVPNHENVQRSRLRVDTRFKLLEALDPATFGKKLDISNKDGSFASLWAAALIDANSPAHEDGATKH